MSGMDASTTLNGGSGGGAGNGVSVEGFAGVGLGLCAANRTADQTIVATALPAIASNLGQVERVSWVVVSYLIANTIAAPVYGRLGDSFGRRGMMLAALALFMVGSVLCAFAPNIDARPKL